MADQFVQESCPCAGPLEKQQPLCVREGSCCLKSGELDHLTDGNHFLLRVGEVAAVGTHLFVSGLVCWAAALGLFQGQEHQ